MVNLVAQLAAGIGILVFIVGGIVVLAIVVGLYVMGVYNSLQRLRVATEAAFSGIDVQLKRRHDLIPNLVSTVQGYAAHERGTLEAVIQARAAAMKGGSIAERGEAEAQLTGALGRLMAVAEAYPDLKANQNFLQLQGELSGLETGIAQSRGGFNGSAQGFNATLAQFPANIVGRLFGFTPFDFFKAGESERAVPVVKF
ncbi:MAG: LemA family protein [Planctomycetes bacterium]|nr:LemA family protein [Planctomycetota bacterium]